MWRESPSVAQAPSHAYVPGKNERHREDAFAELRATVVPGHDSAQLASCKAFLAGLQFLHTGYYWEAHEVLEPVWMALPGGSTERRFVQGLIQLANGRLKLLMGRPRAALRLIGQVRGLVPPAEPVVIMTLELCEVHRWIDALENDVFLEL